MKTRELERPRVRRALERALNNSGSLASLFSYIHEREERRERKIKKKKEKNVSIKIHRPSDLRAENINFSCSRSRLDKLALQMTMNTPALFHGEEKKAKRLDCHKEVQVFLFPLTRISLLYKYK